MSPGQAYGCSPRISMGADQDQSQSPWESGPIGCWSDVPPGCTMAFCLSWSGSGVEVSGFVFLLTPASCCGEPDQGTDLT